MLWLGGPVELAWLGLVCGDHVEGHVTGHVLPQGWDGEAGQAAI